MARLAASLTGSGTSVSQTPWARLMPWTFSHSMDITRISDCTVRAARWLRDRDMVFSFTFRAFLADLLNCNALGVGNQRGNGCDLIRSINHQRQLRNGHAVN